MVDTTLSAEGKYFKKYSHFLLFLVVVFTVVGNALIYIFKGIFPDLNDELMEFLVVTVLTTNLCAVISVLLVQRHSERYYEEHEGMDKVLDRLGKFLVENDDMYQSMTDYVRKNKSMIKLLNSKLFTPLEKIKDEEQLHALLESAKTDLFIQLRRELNVKKSRTIGGVEE